MSGRPASTEQEFPGTRRSLAADLGALGVRAGSVLLLHASFTSLGYVCGGPVAVVRAVLDVLGPGGTLVVPTHTPDNSDSAGWRHPPVPESWWAVIREHTPAFDPAVTPSRWMGAVAEVVRTWPGARRSDHPQVSFAALGPAAGAIVSGHRLEDMLGEHSPLARVYDHGGDILLLGADHGSNTSLHLAEYRLGSSPRSRQGAAVRAGDGGSGAADDDGGVCDGGAGVRGGRAWVWWEDVDLDEGDFERLGADLDATGAVAIGRVGSATCRLMSQRAAVDFAVDWMKINRTR